MTNPPIPAEMPKPEGRVPSCDEADQILIRFIDSHFQKNGERPARFTIPADVNNDDDILMDSFIRNARRTERERDEQHARAEKAERYLNAAEANLDTYQKWLNGWREKYLSQRTKNRRLQAENERLREMYKRSQGLVNAAVKYAEDDDWDRVWLVLSNEDCDINAALSPSPAQSEGGNDE